MNAKLIVFMAVVAVAVCNPAAEDESAKSKRHLIAAYPGALAAPWGWGSPYPYVGAWNGGYTGYTGYTINPFTGLPARVAAPWTPVAAAPWAHHGHGYFTPGYGAPVAAAPLVASTRPALLG